MPELLSLDEVRHIECLMGSESSDQERLRSAVLGAGVLQLGDVTFAGGVSANNKLDMTRLFLQEDERIGLINVVAALGRSAIQYDPDALWGVPTGGQKFAKALGQVLEVPVIGLKKDQDHIGYRRFDYDVLDTEGQVPISDYCRMVGIEDVSTTYGSVVGCLQLPELREATKAVAVIWSRGEDDPDEVILPDMRVSLIPLIVEPVPSHLKKSHELYAYGVMPNAT